MRYFVPAAAIALVFSGCAGVPSATANRPLRQLRDGVVEHSPSGMRFPSTVAGFNRVYVRQFDAAGANVGVGYNSTDSAAPVAITVYVYPSPPVRAIAPSAPGGPDAQTVITRDEFQRAKAEILQVHPNAKSIDEQEIPAPGGARRDKGYFGRFAYAENFVGAVRPVESLLYVYGNVGGSWTVKYRVTYPAASLGARTIVNRFMQELAWTIQPPSEVAAPTPPPR